MKSKRITTEWTFVKEVVLFDARLKKKRDEIITVSYSPDDSKKTRELTLRRVSFRDEKNRCYEFPAELLLGREYQCNLHAGVVYLDGTAATDRIAKKGTG